MVVLLISLDGWGIRRQKQGNAIELARTPHYDRLLKTCPHSQLKASSEAVGLMPRQIGSSEVGHLHMGAGRVVWQDLPRITHAIKDGSFYENKVLVRLVSDAKKRGAALHLMGLLSDGGVHSHILHLIGVLELCKRRHFSKVFIHGFLDGRDVPPRSALKYIRRMEREMKRLKVGKFASISGRYYAMDRDKRWPRTQKAYEMLLGASENTARGAEEAVRQGYARGENDEFVHPTVILAEGKPVAPLQRGDSVFFFNFRADRARQLSRALADKGFRAFPVPRLNLYVATMTDYDAHFPLPAAFPKPIVKNGLAEVVSRHGLRQFHVAETEKYAHVTYFFNGGEEKPFPGEERVLVPSPKVATYDLKPEMSAYGITDEVVKALESRRFDFIIVNFANADMVGHTGVLKATIRGVEAIDACLGKIMETMEDVGGTFLLTADHGNAEQMLEGGKPKTAHTLNPVPCILFSTEERWQKGRVRLKDGTLCNVAPTLLELLGLKKPKEMTEKSLLLKY